jgi:hypothetical protein
MADADSAPDWVDDLAFPADGPPWLSMGVGRVAEPAWLLVDGERPEQLALRARLLAERHDEVFRARPGTELAGAEALALVRAWFDRFAPGTLTESSKSAGSLTESTEPRGALTESTGPGPAVHPLEVAGRLVQEDLVLMVPRDGGHHLDAACLCFPSHWRLADKFEGSAAGIHGPVPRYPDELEVRVDRYLDRLRPGTVSARRNWSIHDRPDLFAPERPDPARVPVERVPTALWLRSERQTLRRLPASGAVLFTIRVQQAPLGVLAARPEAAGRLAARIRAQPDELTAMNGVAPHRTAVLAWLDGVSGV